MLCTHCRVTMLLKLCIEQAHAARSVARARGDMGMQMLGDVKQATSLTLAVAR
jgi:hypothetical protein